MADRLLVQTDVLRRAGSSLRTVHGELDRARDTADVGSDVIAHGRLRGRVHDFGSGWDKRRTEMMAAIEGLGEAAVGAADVYERIETELVAAMAGDK